VVRLAVESVHPLTRAAHRSCMHGHARFGGVCANARHGDAGVDGGGPRGRRNRAAVRRGMGSGRRAQVCLGRTLANVTL